MAMTSPNMTGFVSGRLTVIEKDGLNNGSVYWLCQCRCGNKVSLRGTQLRHKSRVPRKRAAASCGRCNDLKTHPIEYTAWCNMIARCYHETNPSYHNYGGRGITVCLEWRLDFLNFLDDIGKRPSDDLSLERKDNDGNYNKDNCKWATVYEQHRNRRVSK